MKPDSCAPLLDPGANSLRRAQSPNRQSPLAPKAAAKRDQLMDRLFQHGPTSLAENEKLLLLRDPARLLKAHRTAWTADNGAMRKQWMKNGR